MAALSADVRYPNTNPNPTTKFNPITNPNSNHNVQTLAKQAKRLLMVSVSKCSAVHNCAWVCIPPAPSAHCSVIGCRVANGVLSHTATLYQSPSISYNVLCDTCH